MQTKTFQRLVITLESAGSPHLESTVDAEDSTCHESMSKQELQDPKFFEDVAEALLPEIYARARQSIQIFA